MTPEDRIYRELMIRGSKAKLPEGWGRTESSLGVNVTRPKSIAMANPNTDFSLDKNQMMDEINNSEMRDTVEIPDDYALTAGDFTPDSEGFIGGYHQDDLIDQMSQMRNDDRMTDSDLSALLNEIESERDIQDPKRKESNRFLEYSIRQGMGK
jgi:hypothetical protein